MQRYREKKIRVCDKISIPLSPNYILYNVKIASIGNVDKSSEYKQEFFHNRLNDHFVSSKPLKTDTVNLRDTLSNLLELADYLRNKTFDVNNRNLFLKDQRGVNDLENFGQRFTNLMCLMKELIVGSIITFECRFR